MKWLADFKEDIDRCVALDGGSAWKHVLLEQGLWALMQYRVERAIYHSRIPALIKLPLRLGLILWRKLVEITTSINLPCTAEIGAGLHLPHCGMRVVNARAVIGVNCTICQGATIGVSGRGQMRGVPVIGNRVYIGVNAVVVGKISVGDDALVGANSLVNRDVPAHCTAVGVPAAVTSENGSSEYLGLKNGRDRIDSVRPTPRALAGR